MGNPTIPAYSIDLNNDNNYDYYLGWDVNFSFIVIPQGGPDDTMNEVSAEQRGASLGCWPLNAGVSIGDNLPGNTVWDASSYTLAQWMMLLDNNTHEMVGGGTWFGEHEMFLGLRFDAADGVHYGWVRMSVYSEYGGATIHDWAYNTVPGEGLVAGVVPEPSTIALFLIGIVAFGVKQLLIIYYNFC